MIPRRRRLDPGGRLPSLGQDYTTGHRQYVQRIGAGAERWLRTKPFSAPPGYELLECLRTFAHVVNRLGLPFRAQVLDVGCGPGWLSEFLARCGYQVTGIDVSDDMVRIARERLAAIPDQIGEGVEVVAEFHAMPVRDIPWSQRFDAAVLYDAMHHFDEEVETLSVIRRALVPGGRLFIHEGIRPEPGSAGEQALIEEMTAYGTLESPFDPHYLESVLRASGFAEVTRFAAVDELLDLSAPQDELERIATKLKFPPMNTMIAVNPTSFGDHEHAAVVELAGPLQTTDDGRAFTATVRLTNSGKVVWPTVIGASLPRGVVTVAPYVQRRRGRREELARVALPHAVVPGQSVELELRIPSEAVDDASEFAVDLVHEGMCWFADYGTQPLIIPLQRRA